MATHIPFRAWCPHCVAGKGKCQPHFRGSGEEVGTPTIAFDYMYMKSELSSRAEGAEEGREEVLGGDESVTRHRQGMPILVARDNKTGWFMSEVVPSKGKCAHAVSSI